MNSTVDDGLLNPDRLQQFAIVDKETDFENALQSSSGAKVLSGGVISLKSSRSNTEKQGKKQTEDQKSEKKRNKHDHSSTSKMTNKKRRKS